MATVSVRLPDSLAEKLAGVARDAERPKSFIIQKAIEAYLDDYADVQIALDRLRDSSDQLISSRDMRKSLGI